MKIPFQCMHCLREQGAPNEEFTYLEIRNDGLYEFNCRSGHRSLTVLQQQKFEILFEFGAHAIVDGYYREATTSFSAALERFYEYATRVFSHRPNSPDAEFARAWNKVAAQSERQLGAFIFSYLSRLGKCPELLPPRLTEFRNNVVHRGYLPTKEEATDFGEAVKNLIEGDLELLEERFSKEKHAVLAQHVREGHERAGSIPGVATMSIATIVSIGVVPSKSKPLAATLMEIPLKRQLGLVR